MSKRAPAVLLDDIATAIARIERYTADLSREQFVADEKTVDATVRNLEVIGEAVRQLPEAFTAAHPELPWSQVAGLRNRIVHEYAGIDLEIIWNILRRDLPELKKRLAALSGC